MTNEKSLFELIEENAEKTFDEVIAKPDARKQFIAQVKKLAEQKRNIQRSGELLKDDIDATAEAFKISKGDLGKLVDAQLTGKVEGNIEKLEQLIDKYQILIGEESIDE
jgi:hypothetical protein